MRRVLMVLLLAACTEPQVATNAGHYALATIADQALPVPSNLGFSYYAGSLELRGDSSYVDVLVLGNGKPTTIDSVVGRYIVDGDSIRFTPLNWNVKYSAVRRGNVLLVVWGEGVFRYRRD
jgi:hypothetical protein